MTTLMRGSARNPIFKIMTVTTITILSVVVAFMAGLMRGYTGFGGPAFILAVMTWFLTPLQVIGKVLIIECVAATYLAWRIRRDIDWRTSAALTVPTLLGMPIGHWFLLYIEPEMMRRLIAAVILLCCLIMLSNLRYHRPLPLPYLIMLGITGGVIIGASYIALVVVAVILMGPYDRNVIRTLLVSWGFVISIWYVVLSVSSGNTGVPEVIEALPAAAAYFIGSWVGANRFAHSTESSYRRYALFILTGLALIGMLR